MIAYIGNILDESSAMSPLTTGVPLLAVGKRTERLTCFGLENRPRPNRQVMPTTEAAHP